MSLTKYKLGKLLEHSDIRNDKLEYTLDDIKGISIQKIFIETKANMKGVSLSPYKLVKPNEFAYVTVTSRNGEKISLAHNITEKVYIVSSSYEVFRVKNHDLLLPDYLFMYFNRLEFDRFARFNSWGSARETFDWDEFCDIEIELPEISIQQKYVNVYKTMLENQKNYERGLDDLKLVCDAYIDFLKQRKENVQIGDFIVQIDNRNTKRFPFKFKGLSMDNLFISSIADSNGLDFSNYKIVSPKEFGAVLMKVGRDGRLTIARNDSNENYLISPAYYSFAVQNVNSDYFMANVSRSEFERKGWFLCDSSARGSLSWDEFISLCIPRASQLEQEIVAKLHNVLIERKEINEKLKSQLKDICPILIKGSIEEGRRMKEA